MAKPDEPKPEEKADEPQRDPIPFEKVARKLLATKPASKTAGKGTLKRGR